MPRNLHRGRFIRAPRRGGDVSIVPGGRDLRRSGGHQPGACRAMAMPSHEHREYGDLLVPDAPPGQRQHQLGAGDAGPAHRERQAELGTCIRLLHAH